MAFEACALTLHCHAWASCYVQIPAARLRSILQTLRCCINAQAYPTTARTFALGCNNAMSRVGALLAPLLAVDLASRSAAAAHGAEGIIAGACFVAAAATAALPYETRGRQLTVRPAEAQLHLARIAKPSSRPGFCQELHKPKPLLLQVTGEAGEEAKLCRPSGKPGTPRSAGAPAAHCSASHPRPSAGLV